MRIRHLLLLLVGYLALALLGAVAVQIVSESDDVTAARRLLAYNEARGALLLAAAALGNERSQTYLSLLGAGAGRIDETRAAVDRHVADAAAELDRHAALMAEPAMVRAEIAEIRGRLSVARSEAAAAPQPSPQSARDWFTETSGIIAKIQALRVNLFQAARPLDFVVSAEGQVRNALASVHESVAQAEAIVAGQLATARAWPATGALAEQAGRIAFGLDLVRAQTLPDMTAETRRAIAAVDAAWMGGFGPLLSESARAVDLGRRPDVTADAWVGAADDLLDAIAAAQLVLVGASSDRLTADIAAAENSRRTWVLVLAVGILAAAMTLLVVRNRVIRPIEGLRAAMLRLAEDDLSVEIPRRLRRDEVGEMVSTLRVFKATAIRRQRLQAERLDLHRRLEEGWRQVHRDLSAAGAIQRTLLPAPGVIDGIRYEGLFRPASAVGGDTSLVLRRPSGTVAFVQVDVAGHGAPAAMVSVATHHMLSRLLTLTPPRSLADIVAEANDGWPDELPHFTLLIGEIDPASGALRMIQAGHPAPLLFNRSGWTTPLGDGGVPIGMVKGHRHEVTRGQLAVGDRLVVLSDGVVEATAPDGTQFGDDGLLAALAGSAGAETRTLIANLQDALLNFRDSENFEDDVSVLVLERLPRESEP